MYTRLLQKTQQKRWEGSPLTNNLRSPHDWFGVFPIVRLPTTYFLNVLITTLSIGFILL